MPQFSRSLAVGTHYIPVAHFKFPLTVTAVPGASATVTVATSTTADAATLGASANWTAWPSGGVTANTTDAVVSPVSALRVVVTTATSTLEMMY